MQHECRQTKRLLLLASFAACAISRAIFMRDTSQPKCNIFEAGVSLAEVRTAVARPIGSRTRTLYFAACCAAMLAVLGQALGADQAEPAWVLEHFGDEVSILRSQPVFSNKSQAARIFMSCDGQHRRLRLELPALGRSGDWAAREGYLMIRQSGTVDRLPIVARFAASGARLLVVGETSDREPIAELSRLLATKPAAVDVLLRPFNSAALRQIEVYVLLLRFGRGDIESIQRFRGTCIKEGHKIGLKRK